MVLSAAVLPAAVITLTLTTLTMPVQDLEHIRSPLVSQSQQVTRSGTTLSIHTFQI